MTDTSPKLLSGGNPQIPKGEGAAPVAAYLAAMPDWKRDVGRRIHAAILAEVPDVAMAVKWNSPFYGVRLGEWFLNLHCFTSYIKITFFRGGDLVPPPPERSKYPAVRALHIREGEAFEDQLREWVRQAALLPGEKL